MAKYESKTEKITRVETISSKTLHSLSKRDNFVYYLKTASHLYKYDFHDSMMIHAQKPNATAVASYEQWNSPNLKRYVNRNTKGILLLRTNSKVSNLKYVYDISDTNGAKLPYLWKVDNHNEQEIIDRLTKQYSHEQDFNTLEDIVNYMIDEQFLDEGGYLDAEFEDVIEDSFFEELPQDARSLWLNNVMYDAVKATVMLRCGNDIDEFDVPNDFLNIENFNTPETMIFLGQKANELSKNVLHDIEVIVKDIQKRERVERRKQNDNRQNRVQGERSRNADTPTRGIGSDNTTTRQTRSNAHEIPRAEPQSEVLDTAAQGRTTQDVLQETTNGTESNRPTDTADETKREQSSIVGNEVTGNRESSNKSVDTEQVKQSDIDIVLLDGTQFRDGKQSIINFFHEENSLPERAEFLKEAYGIGGDSIEYESGRYGYYAYDENGINIERGEQFDEAVFLSYDEATQHINKLIQTERYFEPQHEGETLVKPTIDEQIGIEDEPLSEQECIDTVLLGGNGFEGGKQRIIDFYFEEHTNKEKSDFLKNEYGTGGGTVIFTDSQTGYQDHNSKGIIIRLTFYDDNPLTLTWAKVTKRIDTLIESGRYFEPRYPSEKPLIKPKPKEQDVQQNNEQGADENAPFLIQVNEEVADKSTVSAPKKRRTQAEINYARLKQLAPHIIDKRYSYAKLKADGYMDLSIEWIAKDVIAMAHYGEQNGDIMADPDMTFIVDTDKNTLMPFTYQNDYVGLYQEVYSDDRKQWKPKLSRELTSFTSMWFRNIETQGRVITEAKHFQEELADVPITFNQLGQEYGHDVAYDMFSLSKLSELQTEKADIPSVEKFKLGFGLLGNGTIVWNSLKEIDGDYQQIAHISEDGEINYYVDDLPIDVREQIEAMVNLPVPEKQQEMQKYGYQWDGMINLDDEEALRLFDAGNDIYLLHDDNSESLCDGEKRLIQHINDGGLVGLEKELDYLLDEPSQIEETSQVVTSLVVDNGEYKPLFEAIVMQGNVSLTGKNKIVELVNESPDMNTLQKGLKGLYGDFWSQINFNDETKKWHITSNGLDVFVNGFDKPKLHYTWDDISTSLINMVNTNSFLEQEELPASRLSVGMIVTLNDRTYRITKINTTLDSISLDDLTFAQSSGFPIGRKDSLSSFEQQLENDGFFKQSEEHITPKNFTITDDKLGHGGSKEKYKRNVAAIILLKQIELEQRVITPDEQNILSQYVGFGGLADVFDDSKSSWSNEFNELQELLTPKEYDNARASTLSSFYTQPIIIKEMYYALSNMGLKRGNILEPSMGIGNFIGSMTDEFKNFNTYGVELDSLTGRIAKQLYPEINIQITGFENTKFQDNFFDIAIGNVPFGNFGVSDGKYDKHKFMIHDYFFAKSLDKVRAGGIVAFITSKGTLDKANPKFREYLSHHAELVGAVRLPNNAFKANAGTEVTSDIIFLRKRDSIQDITDPWVYVDQDDNGTAMNQYFVDNPHMILGNMETVVGRFGEETVCTPFDEDIPFSNRLHEAMSFISEELSPEYDMDYDIEQPENEDTIIPADPNVKNYSYTINDDIIYYRENSIMTLTEVGEKANQRIRGMIGVRESLKKVIDYQVDGYSPKQIKQAQTELNNLYDDFVEKHGRINTRGNSLAFREDSAYYLLSSLELLDNDGKFKEKADIFNKPTIRPVREITHADTASEALTLSLSEKGYVDIGYMASLTDKQPSQVIEILKGVIFKEPLSDMNNLFEGWKTADEYLSGNVRNKLKIAKEYGNHELVSHNAAYLENVQPQELSFDEIDVRIGSIWIPPSDYYNFIHETLNTPNYYRYDMEVNYSKVTGEWNVSNKNFNSDSTLVNTTFGTRRKRAYHIIENALNLRQTKIYDRVEDGEGKVRSVLNKKETLLASQKQTILQEEFKTWIWKDPKRREQLAKYYNENFNNIRLREYDGSHLTFNGMSPTIQLRPHQKNAIARQLYGNNALLAHVVGAGKSFTMIAGAMEKKRLGLSTKNIFVVPNHLTEQMATEILRLYPSANVLVTTKRDFQTSNRKRFCSKIATGEYDIVVIGHSQFEKIPLSFERQARMINEQINDIANGIMQLSGQDGQRFNIKQMENTKKKLETRLKQLNSNERKDDVITFEQLGVDGLYVDESHMFKNLFLYSKMNNVSGVQQTNAQKSTDMFMKCQYMDEITNGRGICFATGTPISNSMVEMYTVQRYLQMADLKRKGLNHFDSWASIFGEQQTAFEISVDGNKFRSKTRFNKFHNLPELMNMFKEVADVQTADMLNLPTPKLKTGKVQTVLIKPTDIQKKLIKGLGERSDKIMNKEVKPHEDNMLVVTNDGRKIALDQRIYNPCLPDDPNSKVNVLMENIFDIWERNKDKHSTQIVFCDISTPKKTGEFSVYNDLKAKWIAKGIPEHEIGFIQDTKNDVQKKALFDKVRSGEVRILMGSTQMMGTGTNVQDKLIALHHVDVPWRPSDLEQREGRILRQGNENDEVEVFRYITEETFDAYSYQLIEQKQKFISQIMTSKSAVRSAEDIDDKALSYAEVKALATGNPAIKEKMELDFEVQKLKLLKNQFINSKYTLENRIYKSIPAEMKMCEEYISNYSKDAESLKPYEDVVFLIELNGITFDDKAKAGAKLIEICSHNNSGTTKEIGLYNGMKIETSIDDFGQLKLHLKNNATYTIELGQDPLGNIQRIDNVLKGVPDRLDKQTNRLDILHKNIEEAKVESQKPFLNESELRDKLVRLEEINHELATDKADDVIEMDDKDIEDDSREKSETEKERG